MNDFTSLSQLFSQEGCPVETRKLFNVTEQYDGQLLSAVLLLLRGMQERIEVLETRPHALCVPTLMRDFAQMIDTMAPPKTLAELVYASWMMGKVAARLQTKPHALQQWPTFRMN